MATITKISVILSGHMQTKSHLYIDFSGDLGFKLNRGSTKYVAFAMIVINGTVNECWDAIEEIRKKTIVARKKFSLPANYEFKYHRSKKYFRTYWQCIRSCNFKIRYTRIDKSKIKSREQIYPKIAELFLKPSPFIRAQLYLDKIGSKQETRRFLKALKKEIRLVVK